MQKTGSDKRFQTSPVAPAAAALVAVAFVAMVLAALTVPATATALNSPVTAGPVLDPIGPEPDISRVVPLARKQFRRRVSENRSDNVPRFRNGKGRAGFDSYLGTRYLRQSRDRSLVAIQVRDMSRWARQNGHWSYRARPGYLVAYGRSHMGIVIKADRKGRAIRSIEGNKNDRVSKVRIEMSDVTGYISPVPLEPDQVISRHSALADIE